MTSGGSSRASVAGGLEHPMVRGSTKRGIFLIGKLQKVFMDTAPHKSNGLNYPLLVTNLSIRNFMGHKKQMSA
jgi:hypothetical protein